MRRNRWTMITMSNEVIERVETMASRENDIWFDEDLIEDNKEALSD
jgi:hypothetical protein